MINTSIEFFKDFRSFIPTEIFCEIKNGIPNVTNAFSTFFKILFGRERWKPKNRTKHSECNFSIGSFSRSPGAKNRTGSCISSSPLHIYTYIRIHLTCIYVQGPRSETRTICFGWREREREREKDVVLMLATMNSSSSNPLDLTFCVHYRKYSISWSVKRAYES